MPLGSLVTVIDADLRLLEQKLKEAKRLHQEYARDVSKISTVQIGAVGARGGGGGGSGGGIIASPDVQARLNDLRQKRVLTDELKRQDAQDARDRIADRRRRDQDQRQAAQERQRQDADEIRAANANSRTKLNLQRGLDRMDADAARERRNEERKNAAEKRRQDADEIRAAIANTRTKLNLQRGLDRMDADAARERNRASRQRTTLVERADSQLVGARTVENARRLRQEASPLQGIFGNISQVIQQRLNKGLESAFRIANELKLVVGFGVLGGLIGIAAEGIKLNKEFDQFRITMGATIALTHDVVDSMGRMVGYPAKLNFILGQTPKYFQEIRKIAAETLLEQNELVQTISENIGLASQAGFKINTPRQRQQTFGVLANIAQLAKAIGLPGGQRQLTQEVRALLQGERLQGATIAKILGFNSGTEITKLQQQPSTQGNANKFIDELTKRLKDAQPFLDQFKNSFSGLATTLISQGKEFLRLSFTPVFQRIVDVMRRLRDQFGDDAIQRGAQRIGESLANIVDAIVRIGESQGAQLLFKLFELMAANADKLIAVWTAMKVVGTVGALGGAQGGGAAIAGAGLRGIAGALGPEALIALGLPATMVGGGLLTAGGSVALGAGVALGTATQNISRTLGEQAGRGELQPLGTLGQTIADDPGRSLIIAQIQQEQIRLARRRQLLQEFRQRGRVALPGMTERVTESGLEHGVEASEARIAERRKSLVDLNLQMIAKANEERNKETVKERLDAMKAMAEARRDREGELKADLAINRFQIRENVKDQLAAQQQRKAAEITFLRDVREYRQDEYVKTKSQFMQLTNDEIGQVRLETQKELFELDRRKLAYSDYVRLRQAITDAGQRKERIQRLDQRDESLKVQGETAKNFGQSIRAQAIDAAQAGDALIKQFLKREISERTMVQGLRALNFRYHEDLRKQREDIHNRGVDLLRKFADETKRQTDLQKNYRREQADLEERLAKRQKELLKEREDAERGLTQSIRRETEARQNLESGRATREIREQFRQFADFPGATRQQTNIFGNTKQTFAFTDPTIREQLTKSAQERVRQEQPDLTRDQQIDVAFQQVNDTIRELSDMLVGPDGFNKVIARLGEMGVNLTLGQKQQLAGLGIRAGGVRQGQQETEDERAAQAQEQAAQDAKRDTDQARERLAEVQKEQVKFPAEAERERADLNDKFKQEVRDNTIELFRLGQEVQNFRQEVSRAGIAIDQTLIAAITRLAPLLGLAPLADQRAIAAAGAVQVPGPGLQAGIKQKVKGFRQEFFDTGNAFSQPGADLVQSAVGASFPAAPPAAGMTTINNFYDLGDLQIGPDTKSLLDELGKKLQRDARRTP